MPERPQLSDHSARDHWLCPGCGTFDGPISYRRCDACDERPEVRAMGYLDEADRLRAENEALKTDIRDAVSLLARARCTDLSTNDKSWWRARRASLSRKWAESRGPIDEEVQP